jgi:hypothetical protein
MQIIRQLKKAILIFGAVLRPRSLAPTCFWHQSLLRRRRAKSAEGIGIRSIGSLNYILCLASSNALAIGDPRRSQYGRSCLAFHIEKRPVAFTMRINRFCLAEWYRHALTGRTLAMLPRYVSMSNLSSFSLRPSVGCVGDICIFFCSVGSNPNSFRYSRKNKTSAVFGVSSRLGILLYRRPNEALGRKKKVSVAKSSPRITTDVAMGYFISV